MLPFLYRPGEALLDLSGQRWDIVYSHWPEFRSGPVRMNFSRWPTDYFSCSDGKRYALVALPRKIDRSRVNGYHPGWAEMIIDGENVIVFQKDFGDYPTQLDPATIVGKPFDIFSSEPDYFFFFEGWTMHDAVKPFVECTGFGPVSSLG